MHQDDENYIEAFLKMIMNQKISIDTTTTNLYLISFIAV